VASTGGSAVPPPVAMAHNAPPNMPPVPPDYRPATASAPPTCRECGTVESVREVAVQQAQGPGIGAVAGGILGGVLGHQMGHGRGNDAATVLGAVGGAFAGHQIERSQHRTVRYEIAVRMDDGTIQMLNADNAPAWRGGERVKVVNGVVMPMI
jgi:outer membrane lipoprotein SlyB